MIGQSYSYEIGGLLFLEQCVSNIAEYLGLFICDAVSMVKF